MERQISAGPHRGSFGVRQSLGGAVDSRSHFKGARRPGADPCVPARGFVWDAERVAFLMDSLYKGYPFGSIIIWRTKSQLRTERNLGPFELPDNDPDYPIDYALDGQQRLTSIFGVFQTDLAPIEDSDTSWTKIYFDFDAEEDLQESQFLALGDDEAVPGQHFPISTFFDSVAYRSATEPLDEDQVRRIDDVQAVFKEASIPTQIMETDDRDESRRLRAGQSARRRTRHLPAAVSMDLER